MLTNLPEEITAEEVVRLFQVMRKYDVTCDMETYVEGMASVSISGRDSFVDAELLKLSGETPAIFILIRDLGISLKMGCGKHRFYKSRFQYSRLLITVSGAEAEAEFYTDCIPPIAWEEVQREQEEATVV